MKSQTPHTPTPWSVVGGEIGKHNTILCGNGLCIDNVPIALAEKIVRAVNAHEELVSVLKDIYSHIDFELSQTMPKRVEDILAKAEGK